jgi:RNAse (barnase) inhibitor barstar
MNYTRVVVDWSIIKDIDSFYDIVLPQCGSPSWHGRNLSALNDSWVAGRIDTGGPPFDFEFRNLKSIPSDLESIANEIFEIAQDSVAHNGGSIIQL